MQSRYTYRGKKSPRPDPNMPPQRGAVREVPMQNSFQFGMRYAKLPAADRRHTYNGGVVRRIAKRVAADHSGCSHDDKTFVARRRNVQDSSRCSSQST
jgi:hypothetical protein